MKMKMNYGFGLIAVSFIGLVPSLYAEKSLHAHVHGEMKFDIATENKKISINLDGPAESIVGFEYEAKSEKEKKIWADMIEKWNSPLEALVVLDPELKCKAEVAKIEREGEEDREHDDVSSHSDNSPGESKLKSKIHEGVHSEINISVDINCAQDLVGKDLEIAIIENFPKIKKLEINLLRANGNPELRKSSKKREKFKL